MYRRLFLTTIFCLFVTNTLSIKCSFGVGNKCVVLEHDICEDDQPCYCVKFQFPCTKGDQACTEDEQETNVKKWQYLALSKNSCDVMKEASYLYQNITCCSTDDCNKPDNGECTWPSISRRKSMRKLTNLRHI